MHSKSTLACDISPILPLRLEHNEIYLYIHSILHYIAVIYMYVRCLFW